MLKLFVPGRELFDDQTQMFVAATKDCTLLLEHSLLSLSKWESKWKKPFLENHGKDDDNSEEFIDYVRCMTVNQGVDPAVYYGLTPNLKMRIRNYMNDSMTATTVRRSQNKRKPAKKIVTAELIYSWMISYGVPFECQKWHLNRLMTLIEVCMVEGNPPQKMSKAEIMKENAAINAMRRAKHNTKG